MTIDTLLQKILGIPCEGCCGVLKSEEDITRGFHLGCDDPEDI